MSAALGKYSAVLFLDMDGVMILNRCKNPAINARAQELVPTSRNEGAAHIIAGGENLPAAQLKHLHNIAEKVSKAAQFYIVISSNWRSYCTLDELKFQAFKKYAFAQHILDVTPPVPPEVVSQPNLEDRGYNIDQWVQANAEKLGIKAVAVLDDYDYGIKVKFPNQFVYVHNILGQTEEDKVVSLLTTPNFSLESLVNERVAYNLVGVMLDKEVRRTK